jgi:hypothetical protein
MMHGLFSGPWREEFEVAASNRAADMKFREKQARFNERAKEKREEQIEERKEQEQTAQIEAALASPQQVIEFEHKLEIRETATIETLMNLRKQLDAADKRVNEMLDQAYTLPDGRKVFKTKDGKQVFDQNGEELSSKEIDPEAINDTHTFWEDFKFGIDERTDIQERFEDAQKYQTKLDEAREKLNDGNMTAKEMHSLEADLEKTMPADIASKVHGKGPDQDSEFARSEPPSATQQAEISKRVNNLELAPP